MTTREHKKEACPLRVAITLLLEFDMLERKVNDMYLYKPAQLGKAKMAGYIGGNWWQICLS